MANKIKYITTSQHSLVGDSGPLAPGDRVLVDDENNTHKHLVKLIEAEDPSVEHLSLVEVNPGDEKKSQEEAKEMQAKAEKIAAEAREEEARAAQEELEKQLNVAEQQSPHSDPTDFPPQDVEAQKLAEQSGAGQRATTQEDVADEDKESKSSGRRSRKG
jgi:hypothetical protein